MQIWQFAGKELSAVLLQIAQVLGIAVSEEAGEHCGQVFGRLLLSGLLQQAATSSADKVSPWHLKQERLTRLSWQAGQPSG
jgi:hypothetical protein